MAGSYKLPILRQSINLGALAIGQTKLSPIVPLVDGAFMPHPTCLWRLNTLNIPLFSGALATPGATVVIYLLDNYEIFYQTQFQPDVAGATQQIIFDDLRTSHDLISGRTLQIQTSITNGTTGVFGSSGVAINTDPSGAPLNGNIGYDELAYNAPTLAAAAAMQP